MALNHFASQIQDTQKNSITPSVTAQVQAQPKAEVQPEQQQPQSRLAKLEALKVQKAQQKISLQSDAKLAQEDQDQIARQNNVDKAIQAEVNANPALKEIPLTWSDQQMLCALSAMQIRYGRANEAIAYLMMIRKINPKNVECSRLLALAFMRLNRWAEAEAMVEEYDYLQKGNSNGPLDGIVLLYRSLVSFKTNRIADAKAWFGKFRSFNKVS